MNTANLAETARLTDAERARLAHADQTNFWALCNAVEDIVAERSSATLMAAADALNNHPVAWQQGAGAGTGLLVARNLLRERAAQHVAVIPTIPPGSQAGPQ